MFEYINQDYPNKYGEIDPSIIPEQQRTGFWERWAAKRVGAPSPEDVRASQGKQQAQQRVQGLLGQRPVYSQDPMMGPAAPGQPEPQFASQPVMEGGEGQGLLGGKMTPAEFYGGLLTTPGYEPMGAQGMQGLLTPGAKPQPFTLGQNQVRYDAAGNQIASNIGPSGGASEVQSSKIMPGGLVQFIRKDGSVEVKQLDSKNADLVNEAELRGAKLQGIRAGERGEAGSATKAAFKAYEGLSGIRKNIADLNEGISLIDQGAESGVIASRLPSVKAASIKLDNIQKNLGLNIIQNTTFGALSEGELRLAMSTAVPTTLNPVELKQWMTEKRDAQIKLSNYIEDAAKFLGTPGNTISMYLDRKKMSAVQAPQAADINSLVNKYAD